MKYLEFISIYIWLFIRKVIGLVIVPIVLPFRGYANNTVFNYVLKNDVYLKRLLERTITEERGRYIIDEGHGTNGGSIKKRNISWLEYKFAYYVIYQWCDSDSNHDTFDGGYIKTLVDGERMTWLPKFIINSMKKTLDKTQLHRGISADGKEIIYGNTFDIGDDRVTTWEYEFWATIMWNIRNTAYNSKYMTMEKKAGDKNIFLLTIKGKEFGWKQDEDCPENYSATFWSDN